MRTSDLLRWTNNAKNGSKGNSKNWIHSPESLMHGHIAYLVKFLGKTDVDQPKGIEVVKEAIRKLRFSQQLRKAEGQRTPKVELTVSVDGVAIQEPKGKRILHQYPLHRISYCADDKAEKKFFSFIAKEAENDKHVCYVFVSDKLAEEITLTIGQAFDLAYRRFLETTGREMEGRRQLSQLQENVQAMERKNEIFRRRLIDLSAFIETNKLSEYLASQGITSILEVPNDSETVSAPAPAAEGALINFTAMHDCALTTSITMAPSIKKNESTVSLPVVPPRSFEMNGGFKSSTSSAALGGKIEELFLESDDDFDPRSEDCSIVNNRNGTETIPTSGTTVLKQEMPKEVPSAKDIFGAEPFGKNNSSSVDPFGMDDFGRLTTQNNMGTNSSVVFTDRRINEMREGFSRGISFGDDDFNIESLDPLRF